MSLILQEVTFSEFCTDQTSEDYRVELNVFSRFSGASRKVMALMVNPMVSSGPYSFVWKAVICFSSEPSASVAPSYWI